VNICKDAQSSMDRCSQRRSSPGKRPGGLAVSGKTTQRLSSRVRFNTVCTLSRGKLLIPRYTRPEMGRIWSDENKFRCWLKVEAAASLTLADAGIVPENAARAIAERGDFDLKRINEIEAEVRHDVIAFTTAVAEKVGPEARWLHYGLTSNDVVDTAQALQIKEASQIIADDLEKLKEVLKRRAHEFEHTPTIG